MRFAALLLVPALAGAADRVPPPPARHFDDRAGLVAEPAGRALDEKLAAFEARSGTQIVVSIFPSLPSLSLEDFTVRTAQAWRVGQKKLDSGLVLFVFVQERKLRIEVGYGLEGKLPDAVAKRVIEDVIAKRFRAGDPGGGLDAGIDALIAAIEGREASAGAPLPASAPEAPPSPLAALIAALGLGRILGIPLIFPLGFAALALLALPIRLPAIRRRMARGQGFFRAWLAETFRALAWIAINRGTTYSSRGSSSSSWSSGSSGSSGGFSAGGGSFGGGGASGGW